MSKDTLLTVVVFRKRRVSWRAESTGVGWFTVNSMRFGKAWENRRRRNDGNQWARRDMPTQGRVMGSAAGQLTLRCELRFAAGISYSATQ